MKFVLLSALVATAAAFQAAPAAKMVSYDLIEIAVSRFSFA